MLDNQTLWHDVLESVKVSVSPAIFSTWFSQTHLVEITENENRFAASVGCNFSYVKSTIETRYFGLVQDCLTKSLGKPCDLIFVIKQNPAKVDSKDISPIPLFDKEREDKEELLNALRLARLKPGYNFENFAVSSSNQMAYAAAEAVSQNPGNAYNPLFIWGGVGVGKTHLMHAIGRRILEKDISAKVLFCSAEEFTNDIVEGIRNKTTQVFRNKYRKLNALFVDDIQFIAGKDTVQEEFFHTFNAVTGAGGQVVLTSDRTPSEISRLEERLRSRFEAGLIVDIAPPDFELRCAITQIKLKEQELELPMEIIHLIAGNLDAARKIQGFIVKLTSEVKFKNNPITEDLVQSLLGKGVETNGATRKIEPEEIISAIVKYFSIGKRELLGNSRARPVARPRQILMYLLRTQLQLPYEEVGRLVGGRDHTTVMHAVDKITSLASSDVQIREYLMGIKNNF
jgi:chromosomal replication initiator protein